MNNSTPRRLAGPHRFLMLALLAGCSLLGQVRICEAAQFWFAGEDPVVQADKHKGEPADYMDLFRPGAPWQGAAQRLSVFKVSSQFLNRGSDAQILAVIQGLRQRHLALAVAFAPLAGSARCGHGVEGYAAPGQAGRVLGRLRALGGTADYVAFDEPLWFGHEVAPTGRERPGVVLCQDSIDTVAQQAAGTAREILAIFPHVRIGDSEPINGHLADLRTLVNDIAQFDDRFATYSGMKLAFVHLDISWAWPWQDAIAPLAARLRSQGVRLGLIVDSIPRELTSDAWVRSALDNLESFRSALGGSPDDVVVQSWQPLPERMLPESDPATLTYLLQAAEARIR